jgi:hypothetical protein
VAYPALGEPAKLSRGNPGTRCFACEKRRAASEMKKAAGNEKAPERRDMDTRAWTKSHGQTEQTEVESAREVRERRERSVRTCERALRSALASGDERLVRRWSRSLREAEARLAWAEADLLRVEKSVKSQRAS